MGFKIGRQGGPVGAKNQAEIVALASEPVGSLTTEEIKMPGVTLIAEMNEQQLNEFFTTVMKMRRNISEVYLTLGKDYKQQEVHCSVPFANMLHAQSCIDNAKTFVAALASNPKAVGLRATITEGNNGFTSVTKLLVGDKVPVGPSVDEAGNEVPGDPEFFPQLFVTYRL